MKVVAICSLHNVSLTLCWTFHMFESSNKVKSHWSCCWLSTVSFSLSLNLCEMEQKMPKIPDEIIDAPNCSWMKPLRGTFCWGHFWSVFSSVFKWKSGQFLSQVDGWVLIVKQTSPPWLRSCYTRWLWVTESPPSHLSYSALSDGKLARFFGSLVLWFFGSVWKRTIGFIGPPLLRLRPPAAPALHLPAVVATVGPIPEQPCHRPQRETDGRPYLEPS